MQGTKGNKRLFSGKRSNNSQDNTSGVKTPSSVSTVKISLKFNHQTNWNLKGDNADLIWPSWLQSTKAWTQAKALQEYACTLSLKLLQFCCLGTQLLWERSPVFSVLTAIINPSFSQFLAWLCLLTWHPTKRKTQFLCNTSNRANERNLNTI